MVTHLGLKSTNGPPIFDREDYTWNGVESKEPQLGQPLAVGPSTPQLIHTLANNEVTFFTHLDLNAKIQPRGTVHTRMQALHMI